jgi:hypothetical protein
MRPIDRFFSELISLEQSLRTPSELLRARERLGQDFSRLLAAAIGGAAARDLCYRTLDRITAGNPGSLKKLGSMAAFFLEEYDKETMPPLDEDDWREIRETLEDASEKMDINTLTVLMGELLSRGYLD